MSLAAALNTPHVEGRYGYTASGPTKAHYHDGTGVVTLSVAEYVGKRYAQIQAERAGDTSYLEQMKSRAARTPEEHLADKKALIAKVLIAQHGGGKPSVGGGNPSMGGGEPLSPDALAELSEKYHPGMKGAELDELLVALLDMGLITDDDRMIALGRRPVSLAAFGNHDSFVDKTPFLLCDPNPSESVVEQLQRYENALWKQSVVLGHAKIDNSEVLGYRASCQRLLDIFGQLGW